MKWWRSLRLNLITSLVPEKREEVTTEEDLITGQIGRLEMVDKLQAHGIPVSLFIDADICTDSSIRQGQGAVY